MPFRMEPSLQDPFRRELESSLDRRNLGAKSGAKIASRIRTRSTNSDGSHVDSDGGESRDLAERTDRESFIRPERKLNLSVHEESPRDSQTSSTTSRNSRSLDFEANKFALRSERSTSPKPSYGRQMTVAGVSSIHQEKTPIGEAAVSDHKILNDKRRTWAVEELMSELTQMCKERGGANKKPAFQLKSTEVKTSFDPLEKLTREIHEMNRLRSEVNAPESEASVLTDASPINVCKISINSENAPASRSEREAINDDSAAQRELAISEETTRVTITRKNPAFSLPDNEPVASSPKPLKSPKSPKILDEYNEANILNDCNSAVAALHSEARSLSPDKQSFYRKLSNPIHSSTDNIVEQCYSNVRVNAERGKFRPKLKIKTMEQSAELKLTPSLEKLASEIQFLPARRTGQAEEENLALTQSSSRNANCEEGGAYEEGSKSDDSLDRRERRGIFKSLKHKLEYKGSFKTKREGKYIGRERLEIDDKNETAPRKSGLKKSSTLNCATIPECYRRFRKSEALDRFETLNENSMILKRRSRSLSDLESLENNVIGEFGDAGDVRRATKNKPVPLPRTKIPAVPIRRDQSLGFSKFESSNADDNNRSSDRAPSRTIPEQRKTSRERRDEEDESAENKKCDYRQFYSLEKYQNNSDVNGRRNVDIESSTAVGFKTLLCASDSGSDNCLQSKELLSSSNDNLNERGSLRAARKTSLSANFNDRSRGARESLSDEQILSSNASSEALQSHSESEITANLDLSSQPSPVARSGHDDFECSIDLPQGWTQKYDSDTGQICFINDRGDKVSIKFSISQTYRFF